MRRPAALPVLALLLALLALPALLAAQDTPTRAVATQNETGKAGAAKTAGKDAAKPAGKAAGKKAKKARKPPPTPARVLFAAAKTPAPLEARSIGFYAKGCLAGAQALPVDGPAWQHVRLSRNRNWGHPVLIELVEKLAVEAKEHDGWPGLLVGDISQPRGGPMLSGHASHQVGLDADVWFTPMPDRRLTAKEREELSATSMLAGDSVSVDPKVWSEAHLRLLKRAASYKEVERIWVHPAIKKAVCEATTEEKERGWLRKVRAYWGHYYHFHIRIGCPKGSTSCKRQVPVGSDDGCGAELKRWLARVKPPVRPLPPPKPGVARPERRPITLAQLPAECRVVLNGPTAPTATAAAKTPAVKASTVATKSKAAPKSATRKETAK
jgi:penicillin-insensitive murein endopeptidase